ncbi:MAG TPA: hypothetical protein VK071_08470 [Tissierellales bacterium]|nr:hypothetical protein [Tissierellales bacterium]
MNKKSKLFKQRLEKSISIVETILACIILIAVVLSAKDLLSLIYDIISTNATESYDVLQGFFSHVLIMIIGLELAITLLTHTTESILELMLYAISRKMLISSTSILDILLGTISLGILFAIDRFLIVNKEE